MAMDDDQGRAGTCLDAVARLPWWVAVVLAGCSYVVLHCLALRPQTIVVDPGDVRAALAAFLVGGVMESLQYVVPALCLSAVLARLARLPAEVAGSGGCANLPAPAVNAMTAWEFERLTTGGLRVRRPRGKRFAAVA
jgi:restriction system protein